MDNLISLAQRRGTVLRNEGTTARGRLLARLAASPFGMNLLAVSRPDGVRAESVRA